MKKLLLLVGLVVLFFAQSSYAFKFKPVKGNYSGSIWRLYEIVSEDVMAFGIDYKNNLDRKLTGSIMILSKPITNVQECIDPTSKTYFNIDRCEEIHLGISTKIKKEPENSRRIKKFANTIAQDICEDPILIFGEIKKSPKFVLESYKYPTTRIVIKCPKALANKKIKDKENKRIEEEKKLAAQQAIIQEQEAQQQAQVDAQQKKIETCEAYGFEKGSEPFGQCIFKLMELDLEYAKLENETLRLQAQAEQAKLNNQAALANSLAAQAQASNRDKALRIQQFGLAMQGIANSFQTPSSMANPKITCHNFGTQMKCW